MALRQTARSETGFTLLELMVVMAITTILLTLGGLAVRRFWHARSLTGAQDTIVTQLRQAQQRSISEGHPKVYGVAILPGSSNWALVRGTATTNACAVVNRQTLDSGVKFDTNVTNLGSADAGVTTMRNNCRAQLSNQPYQVVFFYPRGTASVTAVAAEQKIQLSQPAIPRTNAIQITPLTGRVTRI